MDPREQSLQQLAAVEIPLCDRGKPRLATLRNGQQRTAHEETGRQTKSFNELAPTLVENFLEEQPENVCPAQSPARTSQAGLPTCNAGVKGLECSIPGRAAKHRRAHRPESKSLGSAEDPENGPFILAMELHIHCARIFAEPAAADLQVCCLPGLLWFVPEAGGDGIRSLVFCLCF